MDKSGGGMFGNSRNNVSYKNIWGGGEVLF